MGAHLSWLQQKPNCFFAIALLHAPPIGLGHYLFLLCCCCCCFGCMPRGSFVVLAFNLPIFMNYCNVVQGPQGADVQRGHLQSQLEASCLNCFALQQFASATVWQAGSSGHRAAAASLSAKFRQHQRP